MPIGDFVHPVSVSEVAFASNGEQPLAVGQIHDGLAHRPDDSPDETIRERRGRRWRWRNDRLQGWRRLKRSWHRLRRDEEGVAASGSQTTRRRLAQFERRRPDRFARCPRSCDSALIVRRRGRTGDHAAQRRDSRTDQRGGGERHEDGRPNHGWESTTCRPTCASSSPVVSEVRVNETRSSARRESACKICSIRFLMARYGATAENSNWSRLCVADSAEPLAARTFTDPIRTPDAAAAPSTRLSKSWLRSACAF